VYDELYTSRTLKVGKAISRIIEPKEEVYEW